jgi:hypothetical protein
VVKEPSSDEKGRVKAQPEEQGPGSTNLDEERCVKVEPSLRFVLTDSVFTT